MKIGAINIGSSTKKSFIDLSHDVSTTCDFGFCQPTLVQAVMPRSSFVLNSHSFVRLAPMPCPTFGRIKVKQDTVYVPMKDVFTAFDNFISGTSVNNPSAGVYTPIFVDFIQSNRLFDRVLGLCRYTEGANYDFSLGSDFLFKQMFTMSISSYWNPFTGNQEKVETSFNDLITSASNREDAIKMIRLYYLVLQNLGIGTDLGLRYNFGDSITPDWKDILEVNGLPSNYTLSGFKPFNDNEVANEYVHSFFRPIDILPYANQIDFGSELLSLAGGFRTIPEQFLHFFNNARSSENADYSFQFTPDYLPAFNESGEPSLVQNIANYSLRLNFHLTPFGKRLFKIFIACGWNFGINNFKCDLPKLFAYYKAWFDLYNVGRDINWLETNCYRLIHSYFDDPTVLQSVIDNSSEPTYTVKFNRIKHFDDFLLDLSMCNYYMDADPITVATRSPLQSKGNTTVAFPNGVTYPVNTSYSKVVVGQDEHIQRPQYPMTTLIPEVGASPILDSMTVTVLARLYEYVNKESVIANKIEDYMRVKYGVDIRSTAFLRRSDFDVQISDIMGTVNNEQTELGEYAGKGVGSGDTGDIKFDVREQGFIIQLTTIVPLGGYPQANTMGQFTRYDFFDETFDSLGMEPMTQSQILARDSIMNFFQNDTTFGFRPRYFGLKYKTNINNGGFAFRSERDSFLPYCLDRLFTESHYSNFNQALGQTILAESPVSYPVQRISLYPDERLRSLGLVESYGNYNRIFYDVTGVSDNFILHMIQDFKYYAPCKPIEDSYDTVDREIDDNKQPVQHS